MQFNVQNEEGSEHCPVWMQTQNHVKEMENEYKMTTNRVTATRVVLLLFRSGTNQQSLLADGLCVGHICSLQYYT